MSEDVLKPPTSGQAFAYKAVACAMLLAFLFACYFFFEPVTAYTIVSLLAAGYMLKMMDRFHAILDMEDEIRSKDHEVDAEAALRRRATAEMMEIVFQILGRYYPYFYRDGQFVLQLPNAAVGIVATDRLHSMFHRPSLRPSGGIIYTGEDVYVKLGELSRMPAALNIDWLDTLIERAYDQYLEPLHGEEAERIRNLNILDVFNIAMRHRVASKAGEHVGIWGTAVVTQD